MIAMFIFFLAVFTILGVVSNALRNARVLQRRSVDGGMVAPQNYFDTVNTNKVPEGENSGDFGEAYPDHQWTTEQFEIGTNGLYKTEILVLRKSSGTVEAKMAILIYNGNAPGSLSRGMTR